MELFSLKNKYALDNALYRTDIIKFSSCTLATVNNTKSNTSVIFPIKVWIEQE